MRFSLLLLLPASLSAFATVGDSTTMSCTPPTFNTETCESCPYAFVENIPSEAIGMEAGEMVTVCTMCTMEGALITDAAYAKTLDPPISCFKGMQLY